MQDGDRHAADEDGENDGGPLLAGNHKLQVHVPEAPRCRVLLHLRRPAELADTMIIIHLLPHGWMGDAMQDLQGCLLPLCPQKRPALPQQRQLCRLCTLAPTEAP